MNRRLRKKRFRGEFAYHGFEIIAVFDPPITDEASDQAIDEFIDFVESIDIGAGGLCGPRHFEMFAHGMRLGSRRRNGRYRVIPCDLTDEHREKVRRWLTARGAKLVAVGPLLSAWHNGALTWPPWKNAPDLSGIRPVPKQDGLSAFP